MTKWDEILWTIYLAVDEVNAALPPERRMPKSPEVSPAHHLDSLGMVNFIISTEEHIAEVFGVTVNLADQQAMSQEHPPFRTIDTLARYLERLLEQHNHG